MAALAAASRERQAGEWCSAQKGLEMLHRTLYVAVQ
jgi:hypothetical protein